MSQIDLGEFMKFCKDFEIPLPKLKIQEVFKKSCVMGHKPLKFEQFDGSLTRLAVEINKVKLQELEKKLKIIDKQIRLNMQNGRG
jgi:Ca2+-binding EF-hand superfamily protein